MIPAVVELTERLNALPPAEIARILAEHAAKRHDHQQICDLDVGNERLRFDVSAINGHLDAHPTVYPVASLDFEPEWAGLVFEPGLLEFDRVASIYFAENAFDILVTPVTLISCLGENMLIDGTHRLAALFCMEMPAAKARLVPEHVWRQFLLPTGEGNGMPRFWRS